MQWMGHRGLGCGARKTRKTESPASLKAHVFGYEGACPVARALRFAPVRSPDLRTPCCECAVELGGGSAGMHRLGSQPVRRACARRSRGPAVTAAPLHRAQPRSCPAYAVCTADAAESGRIAALKAPALAVEMTNVTAAIGRQAAVLPRAKPEKSPCDTSHRALMIARLTIE
jgi:hypothetical protein